jgi:hypothetical protein
MKTPSINKIDTSAPTDRSLNLNYSRRRGPDIDYTARGEAADVRRLVAEVMKRVKYLKDRVARGVELEKALQIHNAQASLLHVTPACGRVVEEGGAARCC